MGILERFKDIVSSGLTDLLDGNDPEEKVREHIVRLSLNLADVRKEVGEASALQSRLERRLEECGGDIKRFDTLSQKAAAAGNQEDARVFISKKYDREQQYKVLEQRYEEAKRTNDKLKETHDRLVREINDLNIRLSNLKAREAAADAQNAINSTKCSSADVEMAFSEMEARAEADYAAAEAEAYVNSSFTDEIN